VSRVISVLFCWTLLTNTHMCFCSPSRSPKPIHRPSSTATLPSRPAPGRPAASRPAAYMSGAGLPASV